MRTLLFFSLICLSFSKNIFKPTDEAAFVNAYIDLSSHLIPWNHYWENCVGSGHATLSLRTDWRAHLQQARTELGFRQVRFHGLFDDDMSVVLSLSKDKPAYSFFNIDQSYSYLVKTLDVRPLVELSFMPKLFASGNTTIFHYEAQTSPPYDYNLWYDLIKTFGEHLVQKFGLEEVRQWNFEVWNEPNCGFWSGSQTEYFKLYNYTVLALKSVDSQLRVGGPATCMSDWISEFLDYCSKNSLPVDFVSTHEYPTDVEPAQLDAMYTAVSGALNEIKSSAYPDVPLFYTEYNDGLFEAYARYSFVPEHDEPYAAAFAVRNIFSVSALDIPLFSWWTFSDIFEEAGQDSRPFHGGYGLMTINSIPKPSWKAFQLLHLSGTSRFSFVSLGTNSSSALTTVGVFATLDETKDEIMIFAYNHNVMQAEIEPAQISLELDHITSLLPSHIIQQQRSKQIRQAQGLARMYIIDDNHCNPKQLWVEMGSPEYPTDEQISELLAASEFSPDSLEYTLNLDTDYLTFDTFLALPQSVIAVQLNLTSLFQ